MNFIHVVQVKHSKATIFAGIEYKLNYPIPVWGGTFVKENQQNAPIIYIFSIYCTYMFRSLLTDIKVLVVTEYSNSTMCAFVQDTIIYKHVIQIQTIVLFVKKLKYFVEMFKSAL